MDNIGNRSEIALQEPILEAYDFTYCAKVVDYYGRTKTLVDIEGVVSFLVIYQYLLLHKMGKFIYLK